MHPTLLRHGIRPHLIGGPEAAETAWDVSWPSDVIVDAALAPSSSLHGLRRREEGSRVLVLVLRAASSFRWTRRREPGTERLARR